MFEITDQPSAWRGYFSPLSLWISDKDVPFQQSSTTQDCHWPQQIARNARKTTPLFPACRGQVGA
jgi:hypothetical protein